MIILCLFFLHIIFSLGYLLWHMKTNFSQALCEFIIIICLPVFGITYLILGKLLHKISYNTFGEGAYKHDKLTNPKIELGSINEYDTNIIPLSDVLYLDNIAEKRTILTNAIRQDSLTDHKLLFKAIKDADREVSHYAAAMFTNMIEKLEAKLFTLEKNLRESPNNFELQTAYTNTMEEYLRIGFLDNFSKEKSLHQYKNVLQKIIQSPLAKVDHYTALFECEISLGNYSQAEKTCENFLNKFPSNEAPYLLYIKLYHHLKSYENLKLKIQELKKSPIHISPNALKIIRFWDGVAINV